MRRRDDTAMALRDSAIISTDYQEKTMNWQTPKATDLRFGFEITMYVANR